MRFLEQLYYGSEHEREEALTMAKKSNYIIKIAFV